jgi:heme/copper-type cytochrome/quinol oxidase subunit 4
VSEARTLWEEGHELGHQMVSLGFALTLTVASLDVTLGGEVGHVFDVAFVVVCATVALLVRPQDFFMIGVLPPLVMLVVFVLVAVARPHALGPRGAGTVQTVVDGLAHHAGALAVGYALCLAVLAVRQQFVRGSTT